LRDSRIISTIAGLTRPERIAQTLDLARHSIPEEVWEQLSEVGSATEKL